MLRHHLISNRFQYTIYNKPTRCNSGSIVFIKNYNKHNTARVASCWFIIYYRLVMHGNSNIYKKKDFSIFCHHCMNRLFIRFLDWIIK